MAPEQLAEAARLIRDGADLDAVCEAVGVERRTLEREWRRVHGTTPARWRREHAPASEPAGPSPVVAFRLPEHAELEDAAEAAGVGPNEWAREAVRRALARRRRP